MSRPNEINSFTDYVENGKVREKQEDPSTASNLFKGAQRKFQNMEKLGISEDTATDYLENTYEAVKMLIQAFMALDGYNPYSHEAIIAYAIDQLDITPGEANQFNKYRKLRNDIAYRGDIATEKEAKEIKQLYQTFHNRFKEQLKEQIP